MPTDTVDVGELESKLAAARLARTNSRLARLNALRLRISELQAELSRIPSPQQVEQNRPDANNDPEVAALRRKFHAANELCAQWRWRSDCPDQYDVRDRQIKAARDAYWVYHYWHEKVSERLYSEHQRAITDAIAARAPMEREMEALQDELAGLQAKLQASGL